MAVTLTAADLKADPGLVDDDRAAQLLAVASEIVTRYAPDAPDAIQDEAVIRIAGWLVESPGSGLVETQRGERRHMLFRGAVSSALRASGAMSLLRPYKPVGAGICE